MPQPSGGRIGVRGTSRPPSWHARPTAGFRTAAVRRGADHGRVRRPSPSRALDQKPGHLCPSLEAKSPSRTTRRPSTAKGNAGVVMSAGAPRHRRLQTYPAGVVPPDGDVDIPASSIHYQQSCSERHSVKAGSSAADSAASPVRPQNGGRPLPRAGSVAPRRRVPGGIGDLLTSRNCQVLYNGSTRGRGGRAFAQSCLTRWASKIDTHPRHSSVRRRMGTENSSWISGGHNVRARLGYPSGSSSWPRRSTRIPGGAAGPAR